MLAQVRKHFARNGTRTNFGGGASCVVRCFLRFRINLGFASGASHCSDFPASGRASLCFRVFAFGVFPSYFCGRPFPGFFHSPFGTSKPPSAQSHFPRPWRFCPPWHSFTSRVSNRAGVRPPSLIGKPLVLFLQTCASVSIRRCESYRRSGRLPTP